MSHEAELESFSASLTLTSGESCFLGTPGDPSPDYLRFQHQLSNSFSFKALLFPPSLLSSLPSGFPLSTLSVLFVTYCGVQLVKERERRRALLDDPELAKPVDGGKKKAE